jgi:bacterioferritin-associated ferredoxin
MIICICHRISERDIAAQAAAGCASFDDLQVETGVATHCGCCRECAAEAFARHCDAGCARAETLAAADAAA